MSATLSKSNQLELIKIVDMKDSKVFVEKPMPDDINICVKERPSYSFASKVSYKLVFEAIFNEVMLKGNYCLCTNYCLLQWFNTLDRVWIRAGTCYSMEDMSDLLEI
jgi:hypothetical protein